MEPLILCPDCHRHVRRSQSACPFCHAAMPAIPAGTTGVALAAAALVAFSLAACGETIAAYGPAPGGSGGTAGAGGSNGGGGSFVDAYGPPPPTDAGVDGSGGAMGAYGPPPHPDPGK